MTSLLEEYAAIIGEENVDHLRQLAALLRGMKTVHVNSTKVGGGVAEMLITLVPLERELGLDVSWEAITGESLFYECTKRFHNALQGNAVHMPDALLKAYETTNQANAERLRPLLQEANVVFIHDPQPLPLLQWTPERRGKWVWRCHIDVSRPYRPVWRYVRDYVAEYDATIFSLPAFSQPLPHVSYLIAPGIDPLSEKNRELDPEEVKSVYSRFELDPARPVLLQVSRFDRFKDPLGVIRAYQIAKTFVPTLQLVLAGGGATDDPEGEVVLAEVRAAAADDADVHVLLLPPDAHRTINALQRAADIVIQKSVREGFGLTVTEGMWKSKPVIGGDTGGIRLQVVNHHTGFLVSSPEGAALRIRYLLHSRDRLQEMGREAKEYVRENFLLTRVLREHLTLMVGLYRQNEGRIYLNG
jgi:trehalose synthase